MLRGAAEGTSDATATDRLLSRCPRTQLVHRGGIEIACGAADAVSTDRALEKELGADLFERSRHGVVLTPAGRLFLPHALDVDRSIADSKRSVSNLLTGRGGDIQVLTVKSLASGVLPDSIARWRARCPATLMRLHDFSHRHVMEAELLSGRGDMAVGPRPENTWAGEVISLGRERMVVVGQGPFASSTVSTAELAGAQWITYEPEQGMSEVLEWSAAETGFEPSVAARVGQIDAAVALSEIGVGWTIAPLNAVPRSHHAQIRDAATPAYREIVAYSRGPMCQVASRFLDVLRESDHTLESPLALPDNVIRC